MSLTASISAWEPHIEIVDHSIFDPKAFGAIGDGKWHPVSDKFDRWEKVSNEHPFFAREQWESSLDWLGWQHAFYEAQVGIQNTVAAGGHSIGRTGVSWSPAVVPSPGRYIVNRPCMIYPHTTIRGHGWGVSDLVLDSKGWAENAPRLITNPQATVWCGNITTKSALLWLLGDVEWPIASGLKVAGMRNSIINLGLICHDGPSVFVPSNQNHFTFRENHLSGWGDGPTGLGIIFNNATSSSQQTNLQMRDNMFEGLVAACVSDKLDIAHLCDNHIESCQYGFFVAHGDDLQANTNTFTNRMKQKPFRCGIHVGVANPAKIIGNIFNEVEEEAIKALGDTTIALNDIRVKNGKLINKSGYGIHVVGPAKQFGGNTQVLGKDICHMIYGNKISCDQWPKAQAMPGFPNPAPLKSIFIDEAVGEKIKAEVFNNVDAPR